MLSWVYSHEFAHGFNPRPGSLDRALAAARKAVDLAPSNHLAFQALAVALFFRKETTNCLSAADRALALNPLDGSNEAMFLIAFCGDWDRGCSLIRRAMEQNPHHPRWYELVLAMNEYRLARYRGVLDEMAQANPLKYPWKSAFLAAAHAQLGEAEAARRALGDLLAPRDDFARSGRQTLEKWLDPSLVDHLMDGLRKAGLKIPPSAEATQTSSDDRVRPSAEPSAAPARDSAAVAIAVLPFSDMSPGQDQDWFAAGTHEALLTALQQIGGLRVTSRTSSMRYRGTTAPMPEIAAELRVRWLVEGSVGRFGDRMRVTAALVDGAEDRQVWSGPFERDVEDILEMQGEIAGAIAGEIHVALTPDDTDRLARAPR